MKTGINFLIMFGILFVLGCSKTDLEVDNRNPTTTTEIVTPGSEIPLGVTVRIMNDGTYFMPVGASILITRCFGHITVSFDTPSGSVQSNTCQSGDGSSNQTNLVDDVSSLDFVVHNDSYAEVALR